MYIRQISLAFHLIVMLIVPITVSCAAVNVTDDRITLDSGKLQLVFQVSENKLSFTNILKGNSNEWLDQTAQSCSLWSMELRGPNNEQKLVVSEELSLTETQPSADAVDFRWQAPVGGENAVITLHVRCPEKSELSYWSLSAKLPKGWQVFKVELPKIQNIKRTDALKMATCRGWGLEYDVNRWTAYESPYPSTNANMQFIAFYEGGEGLYVATHDPHSNYKYIYADSREHGLSVRYINWSPLSDNPAGEYRLPYEAVVGVFAGDYYDAAQIYRKFALTTDWVKKAEQAKQATIDWVKNTQLWLIQDGDPLPSIEQAKEAVEFFGVPISIFYYSWHQIQMDTLYPEYFPTRPGFAEYVKSMHKLGLHVMPYINGRLVDPSSRSWTEEHLDKSAARAEDGNPYTEVYLSQVKLHTMCPNAEQWQRKLTDIVDKLVNEYGVDGVYMDQIAASAPVLCFAPNHGHQPGGGHFWHDAYLRMLSQIRKKLPEKAMLSTEESAECWLGAFDNYLMVNTPLDQPKRIPLYPAVYSGKALLYAHTYMRMTDYTLSLPFREKMAQTFLWGGQFGYIKVWEIMDPKVRKEAEFLRNLARCRQRAQNYLQDGVFLGMIKVGGDNPTIKGAGDGSYGDKYPINTDSVLASAWQAKDGSLGVTLVNISDQAHKINLKLPLDKASILPSDQLAISITGSDGVQSPFKQESTAIDTTIKAGEALILSVSSAVK